MPSPNEIKLGTKIKQHEEYIPELEQCLECGVEFEIGDLEDGLCPNCWCDLEI